MTKNGYRKALAAITQDDEALLRLVVRGYVTPAEKYRIRGRITKELTALQLEGGAAGASPPYVSRGSNG